MRKNAPPLDRPDEEVLRERRERGPRHPIFFAQCHVEDDSCPSVTWGAGINQQYKPAALGLT